MFAEVDSGFLAFGVSAFRRSWLFCRPSVALRGNFSPMTGHVHHAASVARLQVLAARAGYVLGALLVLAALIAIGSKWDEVAGAMEALKNPDPRMIALLVGSVLINIALTGVFFGLLLSRYGRVSMKEMIAVLSAATLLNYLPMQPGLVARLAYHKAYNKILLRDTVKVQIQAIVISSVTSAFVFLLVLACRAVGLHIIWAMVGVFAGLVAISFVRSLRLWMFAAMTRLLELSTWSARYYAAFSLLGVHVDIAGSIAMACISMAVTLIPMFSNGLGIREWAIGSTSPYLTAGHLHHGLAAELVNRAAEVIVVTICGLIAFSWLAHHHHRLRTKLKMEELRREEEAEQSVPSNSVRAEK